jgi:hypothetical protein
MNERQDLRCARRVPPIPHQVSKNTKLRQHDHAGISHTRVRILCCLHVERSRRVCVREHRVPRFPQAESQELRANL